MADGHGRHRAGDQCRGHKSNELVLDGKTLADIYLGTIKKWDDAAIKKLNPGVTLPSAAITVVRRSDGSGTTFNFTDYLAKVQPRVEVQGRRGHGGRMARRRRRPRQRRRRRQCRADENSIGYVEYAYAKQNNLPYSLDEQGGQGGEALDRGLPGGGRQCRLGEVAGLLVILTNQPGEASWPITAATFILMHKQPTDKAAAAEALKFFTWAFEKGDKMAEELDYIPMPDRS